MSKTKQAVLSSRMNEQSRGLFEEVLIKNVDTPVPRDKTTSAFRRHQFVTQQKQFLNQKNRTDRQVPNGVANIKHRVTSNMELDITLPRTLATAQAPHYPFETPGKVALQRARSSTSKTSLRTLQGLKYHGSRISNYSQPPVISSTNDKLLSLTPNKVPDKPIVNRTSRSANSQTTKPQRQLMRYMEFQGHQTPRVQSRNATGADSATPTPCLTPRSIPVMRPHIHYKHGGGSVVVTSALQPRPVKRETPKSALKSDHLQLYRAQLESYLGPRKKDTSFLARRMAPVLRVVPASRVWVHGHSVPQATPKPPPKSGDGSEGASQKRVRFSDQMGLPLTRNMTPTYRKKHSYILRWLESAGRPAPPLA